MLGKFIARDFIAIAGEIRWFLASNENTVFDLLEPWDVRVLSIRKTVDLSLQPWFGTFPRFVAIKFYFLSETLI